jgi:hypothetical protein
MNTCIYFINKKQFVMKTVGGYKLFTLVGLQNTVDTNALRILNK